MGGFERDTSILGIRKLHRNKPVVGCRQERNEAETHDSFSWPDRLDCCAFYRPTVAADDNYLGGGMRTLREPRQHLPFVILGKTRAYDHQPRTGNQQDTE